MLHTVHYKLYRIHFTAYIVVYTPVNKLKVSTTREVKNKSEVKFLKKYRLHAARVIFLVEIIKWGFLLFIM